MGVQAKVGNEEVAPLQPAQMRVRIDALSARVVSIEQAVASCERKLRVLNSRAIGGRSRKVCVPILIQVSVRKLALLEGSLHAASLCRADSTGSCTS